MRAMNGRSLMTATVLVMVAGFLIVSDSGCSKKTVQSGGDVRSSEPGTAKAGRSAGGGDTGGGGTGGVSPSFPDTTMAGRGQEGRQEGAKEGWIRSQAARVRRGSGSVAAVPWWPRPTPTPRRVKSKK
jgi:peptidoglycan-associated lipoprotein